MGDEPRVLIRRLPTPAVSLGLRLTDEERRVIEALLERGESSAEQVAHHTHLERSAVDGILASLSRRRYVAQIVEPDRVTYHAVLPELQTQQARSVSTVDSGSQASSASEEK
jgi:DNA-binding MarR family transcriptional regulator